ncbi:tetratricopeptide repeat protein [Pseudomarimonas arenosa]|uniref:Tetratricopeptide repeat protein n=1 Tax=Pseudomarimonas arenosa TaxID=2774145 RepID=A0AAW3ZR78_9GAMM|nr:tetratricopeptide repeat protein [Pseudomarimonas arenosa]MBD8526761.1 tetratricopeptide repeat protein [Pseudomarimonas arenosa]
MSNPIYQWYFELQRRKVFQAALAYIAGGWLLLQVTEILAEAFDLPSWTIRLVFVLLALGFPLVLFLAWVFDVSPQGMVRTSGRAGNNEWLAAVLWLHLPPQHDEVGNRVRRPLARFERAVLTRSSLWRHWDGEQGQLVMSTARKAMHAAQLLQKVAAQDGVPLSIGLAVGSVHQDGEQIDGEAVQVARELALTAPGGEIRGTEQIHDELINASELEGEFVGPVSIAALAHPVRSYRLRWQEAATAEGERRAGGRRQEDLLPSVPARSRRWIAVFGSMTVALVLLLGAGWWLSRGDSESEARSAAELPTLENSASSARYVELSAIADPQRVLSESERHGLQAAVQQIFEYLPGLYAADQAIPVDAALTLSSSIDRSAERYRLQMVMAADEDSAIQTLELANPSLQRLYAEMQDALIAMLAARFSIQPESMPHEEPMPPELYSMLLEAQHALTAVPSLERTERLQTALEPYLDQQANNLLLHTTYCDLMTSKAQMLKDAAVLGKGEASCSRIAGSAQPTVEARLAYARYLQVRGRTAEAIREISRALSINPRNADAYDLLARAYQDQGNALQAEHTLLKAITMQPGYWRPLRSLALHQFEHSRYADAAKTYRRLLELAPNNGRAWSDLGAAHFMAGNIGEAANAFQRAVQLEPNQAALSNLGTMYYYLGRFEDAIRNYQLALRQAPNDFRLYGNLGDALRVQGQTEQAQQYYQQALDKLNDYLQTAGEDIDTQSLRILYEYHLGSRQHAYRDMLALAQQSPSNAELQLYAAILAKPLQDNGLVLEHLSRAVTLGYGAAIISVDPEFTYLGGDSRFSRLVSNQGV